MVVFETMQEKEIKILLPHYLCLSLPTPDSEPLPYISPQTPHGEGAQFLRHEPTLFLSLLAENKSHLSISPKLSLRILHLASVGREAQDFGQQQFLLFNEKF